MTFQKFDPNVDANVRAVIDVGHPDDVEGFEDLATPDWLDEGTFYTALEMAADADEFAEAIGWGDPEDLELMVDLLGLLDEELPGEEAPGTDPPEGVPGLSVSGMNRLLERIKGCRTIEDWSFLLNDYIQWGNNTKVHKSVAVFNMNSATDCVNRSTERCQVDGDECYAVVDEKRYDYVKAYTRRQEYLWDCLDAETWADAFLAIVDRKYTPVSAVKFSQAGDFRHDGDILKVDRIADRLGEEGIPVFTYSASSHLNWDLAEHVTVNQSNSLEEYGDRRYRVVQSHEEIRDDEVRCPFEAQKRQGVPKQNRRQCGQCRLCIDKEGPDVAVVQ